MPLRRWNHTRRYMTLFYPHGSFDPKLGNNGSNKIPLSKSQHLFMPVGADEGLRLYHRKLKCSCRPCQNGNFTNCEATGIIPPGEELKMKPRAAAAVTRGGGNDTLAKMNEYLGSLKKEDNVVVRICKGVDAHNACESFFMAKVSGKPWTVEETGVYAGVKQDRGFQVVDFYWYDYERTDGNGDFLCRLMRDTGIEPEEYPATALVPKAKQYIAGFKYDRKVKLYRLDREMIQKIRRYCDLDSRS